MADFEETKKKIDILTYKTKKLNESLLKAKDLLQDINILKKEIKELSN